MTLEVTDAYGLNFLIPPNDKVVGRALKLFGEFALAELDLAAAYMKRSKPGALIDVGANIGAICLPLAKGRPDWNVKAIEAHPGLADVIRRNAAQNGLSWVEVVQAAAGAAEGTIEFPCPDLSAAINLGRTGMGMRDQPMTEVAVVRLDDLAPANTRLVKIDVEGMEAEVLAGAAQMLVDAKPVVIFEANDGHEESTRASVAQLLGLGYRLFWFFVPIVSLNGTRKASNLMPKKSGDMNVLALPSGAPVLWRMPEITAPGEAPPRSVGQFPYLRHYGY